MNNTQDHQKLLHEVLLLLGAHPNLRVWPRRVGLAVPIYTNRPVFFGLKGESDIDGIKAPEGKRIAIEIKTGSGRRTKEQDAFKRMIEKFGGIYVECRSIEDIKFLLA